MQGIIKVHPPRERGDAQAGEGRSDRGIGIHAERRIWSRRRRQTVVLATGTRSSGTQAHGRGVGESAYARLFGPFMASSDKHHCVVLEEHFPQAAAVGDAPSQAQELGPRDGLPAADMHLNQL
ncbi:hypothetical protein N7541_000657 [Penicillium brevicompactum]|uniref:Uncharacterized protein n=1 Tax=Penicillium brevicompactum TaxID=5074 RepID=A0A9W9V586_PENBR|nr:hypothetical protein N7541_000657 [Penicillium brevicompactum]